MGAAATTGVDTYAPRPAPAGAGHTVLLVDARVTVRRMAQLLLKGEGRHFLEAAGAAEALHVLRTERVDLVVTDLDLPGVDGLALVRWLRAQVPLRALPVVALTAAGPDGRARLAAAGVEGVPKRLAATVLPAAVARALRPARHEACAHAASSASSTEACR